MPAGSPISWIIKGRPEAALLHIPLELVGEIGAELYERDLTRVQLPDAFARQDPSIERLVRVLLEEATRTTPDARLVADMVSRALVARLISFLSVAESSQGPSPSLSGRRLRGVLDCMHAELGEDLSLARLAGISGISQSYFARAFCEAMGTPPHRYIIKLRMELAQTLLQHPDLSITEVSQRCGYQQPSHFATMFRRVLGLTPTAYRKGFGLDHRG